MLIYNSAFDTYHCIHRLLILLKKIDGTVEIDKIRILDFYVVFPRELYKVAFPATAYKFKKKFKVLNKYETLRNPKVIFERMKYYQLFAINCMSAYGLLDNNELKNNRLRLLDNPIINKIISTEIKDKLTLLAINVLVEYFAKLNILGKNGLKERTKLMETKYDLP